MFVGLVETLSLTHHHCPFNFVVISLSNSNQELPMGLRLFPVCFRDPVCPYIPQCGMKHLPSVIFFM